ncbi:hypothetical protein CEXT_776361 [Caerostris extrusa]|uniref:Uncharacterized protein n=1 Tax=Caerostris extrusa TaxID=172846 RepID=A0AAV4NHF2_CAEEX|nr:hypothetical protein CEXT_776361 [Caerostris extrusa]
MVNVVIEDMMSAVEMADGSGKCGDDSCVPKGCGSVGDNAGGPRAAAGCRRAAPPSGVSRAGTDCEVGRPVSQSTGRGKKNLCSTQEEGRLTYAADKEGGGRSVCTVGMVGKVHETGMSGEEL